MHEPNRFILKTDPIPTGIGSDSFAADKKTDQPQMQLT